MAQDFNYRGEVVVFDLDDTLAPERLFAMSGFRLIGRILHEEYPNLDAPEQIIEIMSKALNSRQPHYDALEAYLKEKGIDPETIMFRLVDAARTHVPDAEYKLRPDAGPVLESLRMNGIRMGLITDGRSRTQRIKIRALNLSEYFSPDSIFISEETGCGKEKPDNFEAMVRLTPEAGRYWYIGDNPDKDFLWPNLLGWKTICIRDICNTNVHSQSEVEPPYSPQIFIKSLSEIPGLLGIR